MPLPLRVCFMASLICAKSASNFRSVLDASSARLVSARYVCMSPAISIRTRAERADAVDRYDTPVRLLLGVETAALVKPGTQESSNLQESPLQLQQSSAVLWWDSVCNGLTGSGRCSSDTACTCASTAGGDIFHAGGRMVCRLLPPAATSTTPGGFQGTNGLPPNFLPRRLQRRRIFF